MLDHLEIDSAFLLGACIGCAVALALCAESPQRCRALLLHWPTGGFRWRSQGRSSFERHTAFVRDHGLRDVVEHARRSPIFCSAPEVGPWASVIASDDEFAQWYVRQDVDHYLQVVAASRDNLFGDAMPSGAPGEALIAMNVPAYLMPGDDSIHTMSCAQALHELMPQARLSPLTPRQQNAVAIANWIWTSLTQAGAVPSSLVA